MSSITRNGKQSQRHYWRSLDELADTPEFRSMVEREFPEQASELNDPVTRRHFLKLMGASLAFAGLTSCRWPKEKIAPYAHRPESRTPGVPEHYATAMEINGIASGLLVKSFDGRPIKIEGNPSHPINKGTAGVLDQASVLQLYDPDRSRGIVRYDQGKEITQNWDTFSSFAQNHFSRLKKQSGKGLYVLSESSSSPSFQDMCKRFKQTFPHAKWFEYEPISNDNERVGTKLLFGKPARPQLQLDKAKVIFLFDADLFASHPAFIKYARDFAKGRRPNEEWMNRLYVIESGYSTTGAMADHRLPLRASQTETFICALAAELVINQKFSLPAEFQFLDKTLSKFQNHSFPQKWIKALAKDLVQNKGQCVLAAGWNQSSTVHAVMHCLNVLLRNVGETIHFTEEIDRPLHSESIRSLNEEIKAGKVDSLLILGGNPVYNSPVDLEFGKQLSVVPNSIHLSLYRNETTKTCSWHVPRAHYLETWGDARAYEGTVCTIQPLIEPLYGGKSFIEFLAIIMDEEPKSGYEITRRTFRNLFGSTNFEASWQKALHDGILSDRSFETTRPVIQNNEIESLLAQITLPTENDERPPLEIVFKQDSCVYDGRFANNGWLQELPDFMTKIAWGNAAIISQETADAYGIQNEELITLKHEGRELQIPVYVMPGHASHSITLPLGYGRTSAGTVGNGLGSNTYLLRTIQAMNFVYGVELTATGQQYKLASTQNHHAIDTVGMEAKQHRLGELVREADLKEYREHPNFAEHRVHAPEFKPLWEVHQYEGHKWGMAIDLNSCIGCNACVAACQAENNIPIVGKEQVSNGREMHWIRIDRYFKGEESNPQVSHQPVACVHCENAPCEQVCPVAATVHSHEGLNLMVYNRCVGTRYCSNNCPYKVRRFNFFNYRTGLSETEKMAYNPEVTVRSRGVMEKCTYCVQRIEAVKIKAKNERRPIEDGEIVPACAQTCPTQAIVFGDLNDKDSQISQLHENNRAYGMLAELNTKPRTEHLARVRNPNPELKETDKETTDESNSHS